MSPELRDHIAAAAVLICDARQDLEDVHKLIQAIAEQAHCEGEMEGLEKSQRLLDKHLIGAFA